MPDDKTTLPIEARIKKWRGSRAGRVEVTASHVLFYCNRLVGKPQIRLEIEGSRVIASEAVEAGRDKRISIHYQGSDGVELVEEIVLIEPEQADALCQALRQFSERREEERKAKEAEEEGRRKEEERKAIELREAYALAVWHAADLLWAIGRLAFDLVQTARVGKWEETRQQYTVLWPLVERLKKEMGLDITGTLERFAESISGRNGEETFAQTAAFLDLVSTGLQDNKPVRSEWESIDVAKEGIKPAWAHLAYLFLFGLSCGEARLCFETGDWVGLEKDVANVARCGVVLFEKFGMDLGQDISGLGDAAGKRQVETVAILQKLEQKVTAETRSHVANNGGAGKKDATLS